MALQVQLRRWYVGLHGLALLRGGPFEDGDVAGARMEAIRRLLIGDGGPAEERRYDVLVDVALLENFGTTDSWLDPMRAVLDLPFASIWSFRKSSG